MSSKNKIQRRLLSADEIALLPRAGLLRRLAALLYDMFLVFAMWMCLGFLIQAVLWLLGLSTNELVDGRAQTNPLSSIVFLVMMGTSSACFYLWFWRRTGQTLGMIAWRIKALRLDNKLIPAQQGLIRFVAAWPAFWLGGLGYLWLYVDKEHDAVHEKLSGTKTVLLPKDARPF
jgi:uncharacterized RDD family membrane protein YckC